MCPGEIFSIDVPGVKWDNSRYTLFHPDVFYRKKIIGKYILTHWERI